MLTDKEIHYIQKLIETGSKLDKAFILDIINKKRGNKDAASLDEIESCMEVLSRSSTTGAAVEAETQVRTGFLSRVERAAKEMKDRERLEQTAERTLHIVAHVLEHLSPQISQLVAAPKPREYCIVSGKTQTEVETKVQMKMRERWQPFGGISAAAFGISPVGGNQYIQAMVKY